LEEVNNPIRLLQESDAEAVAALHRESFKNFFLSQLGYRFLVRFYGLILASEEGLGVGYFEGRQLKGFAIGSIKLGGFYGRLMKKGWWALGWRALPQLITNPRLVGRLYKSLKHKDDVDDVQDDAVLLSIAVAPTEVDKSIGRQLIHAFEEYLLQKGSVQLSLTTDKLTNEKAISFYQKNNYIFVKEIQKGERPMLVFKKKLKL
jgi:ribosomal protein S18 acetylase RimI-like enzyme